MLLQSHVDKWLFLVPGLVISENPAAWKQGGKDLGRPRRLVGPQSESKDPGWETQITEQGLSEAAFNRSPVALFLDRHTLVTLECRLELVTCF